MNKTKSPYFPTLGSKDLITMKCDNGCGEDIQRTVDVYRKTKKWGGRLMCRTCAIVGFQKSADLAEKYAMVRKAFNEKEGYTPITKKQLRAKVRKGG